MAHETDESLRPLLQLPEPPFGCVLTWEVTSHNRFGDNGKWHRLILNSSKLNGGIPRETELRIHAIRTESFIEGSGVGLWRVMVCSKQTPMKEEVLASRMTGQEKRKLGLSGSPHCVCLSISLLAFLCSKNLLNLSFYPYIHIRIL